LGDGVKHIAIPSDVTMADLEVYRRATHQAFDEANLSGAFSLAWYLSGIARDIDAEIKERLEAEDGARMFDSWRLFGEAV
jgi:ribose 1,5-bisphosphokinase PhnN